MFHSISERFNWSRAAILYTDEVPSIKTLALAMITKFTEDKEFNLVTQYIVSLYASDRDLHRIFKSIKNNARSIILFNMMSSNNLFKKWYCKDVIKKNLLRLTVRRHMLLYSA